MMETVSSSPSPSKSNKLNVSLDLRALVIVLVLIIIGMLAAWRPWSLKINASTRTVTVTGQSTIKATPDEFVFYPSYDFDNTDKSAALAALTAKSNDIVAKLKSLGVPSDKIATDSNGYQGYDYNGTDNTYTYSLNLTVTVDSSDLAQKVQDYLVSTAPTGSVSPSAQFSTAKQKQLESQGRDAATKDARSKADQSAQNLGFKVGAVEKVTDDNTSNNYPVCGGGVCAGVDSATSDMAASSPSLAVQPGQNELDYSVTVVYYVR